MSSISTDRNTIQGTNPKESSGLTFTGIARSEWIKLRTLRSTVWCYAIIIVITVGLGLLLALTIPGSGIQTAGQEAAIVVQVSTLGIGLSQLVSVVLGALVITGEYGTGMIRSTLTAVPRRLPALIAKGLVFGVTTFVVGLVAIFLTVFATLPLLANAGIEANLADSAIILPLVGGAGYLALIGVLAFSIGAIIRNSAGGIAASLGLILVVPTVLQVFASLARADWAANLTTFLPSAAGGRMYAYVDAAVAPPASDVIVLDPGQGLLVLVVWIVVLFVGAAVLLRRRDA